MCSTISGQKLTSCKSLSTAVHYQDIDTVCKQNKIDEPWHGISNNVVCATSNASDQPAHTHSLIRAFAGRLDIL